MYLFWNDLCNYLWLGTAFFSITAVLLRKVEKCVRFRLFVALYALFYIGVSVASSFIPHYGLSKFLRYISYSVLLVSNVAIIPFLYKENKFNMFFIGFLISILSQTVRTMVTLLKQLIKVEGPLMILRNSLLYAAILSVSLIVINVVLSKRIKEMTDFKFSLSFILLFVTNASLAMLFSVFIPFIEGNETIYIVYIVFEIIYNIAMVGAMVLFARSTKLSAENLMIKYLWQRDVAQYKRQKDSMELINIKCHDLRFGGGNIDGEVLNAVGDYDSVIRTGNNALDVAVNNASSRCRAGEIKLTCLADGKLLDFMNLPDVFSMMSNILDNAVNCEENYDKQKRFIALSVRKRNNLVVIHCENHFEGEIETENGLPLSSNKDKNNHGFGMKSIKRIVDKYNGMLSVNVQNSMFILDIVFSGGGGKLIKIIKIVLRYRL